MAGRGASYLTLWPMTRREQRGLGRCGVWNELLSASDGDWKELLTVKGNHQRMVRHKFDPITVESLRLTITATNGDKLARVFEVRCYA